MGASSAKAKTPATKPDPAKPGIRSRLMPSKEAMDHAMPAIKTTTAIGLPLIALAMYLTRGDSEDLVGTSSQAGEVSATETHEEASS